MTSCEGHQEMSAQAVAWEGCWCLRNLGSVCGECQTPLQTSASGLQGIQGLAPVAAGRDLSTAQCKAGLGWLLLTRVCSLQALLKVQAAVQQCGKH